MRHTERLCTPQVLDSAPDGSGPGETGSDPLSRVVDPLPQCIGKAENFSAFQCISMHFKACHPYSFEFYDESFLHLLYFVSMSFCRKAGVSGNFRRGVGGFLHALLWKEKEAW